MRRYDPGPGARKVFPRRTGQGAEVGEIVDVVEFQVVQQRVGRGERKKRVGIFARLDEKYVPPSDPESRAVRKRAARDRRGREPRGGKDPVEHRGHRGLPVAARDGHADRAVPHQIREEVGARDHGNAALSRPNQRGMVGSDRGGIDHGGNRIGQRVPLRKNGDPDVRKNDSRFFPPVLPRDRKAPQYGKFRKRRHPDAPDPDKPEKRPGKKQFRRPLPAAQSVLRQTHHPHAGYAGNGDPAIQTIDTYFTILNQFLVFYAYY